MLPLPIPSAIVAPQRRFYGARTGLGEFARTGSRSGLESGLGHYARTGLGGAVGGARRLSGTANTSNALYNVLHSLSTGQHPEVDLGVDPAALVGRPAREIMDVIVEAIRPVDGSQDTEGSRLAVAAATSDLLAAHPEADLLALNPEQIELITEGYVGHDLCQRIELDVGQSIEANAPDAATAVRRLEEMKQYVMATVRARYAARKERGQRLQRGQVGVLTSNILRDTLEVFEDYIR